MRPYKLDEIREWTPELLIVRFINLQIERDQLLEALEHLLLELEVHEIHAPVRIAMAKAAILKARAR